MKKGSMAPGTPATLRRILDYIIQCQSVGVTPTRREIAVNLHIPQLSVMTRYLPRMVADGVIEIPAKRRAITVLRKDAYQ